MATHDQESESSHIPTSEMCHRSRPWATADRATGPSSSADFWHALHWQQEDEEKAGRPLYGLGGVWYPLLLARLGQNEEATRLTEANDRICTELTGTVEHMWHWLCQLVLADLARERQDLDAARQLLAAAHEWAVARDAKEPLCWASKVRAKIALGPNGGGPWQEMELYAFLQQFVKRECPVIPVILPGVDEVPELPAFLGLMTWVDLRRDDPDPVDQLIWGITGEKPGL